MGAGLVNRRVIGGGPAGQLAQPMGVWLHFMPPDQPAVVQVWKSAVCAMVQIPHLGVDGRLPWRWQNPWHLWNWEEQEVEGRASSKWQGLLKGFITIVPWMTAFPGRKSITVLVPFSAGRSAWVSQQGG